MGILDKFIKSKSKNSPAGEPFVLKETERGDPYGLETDRRERAKEGMASAEAAFKKGISPRLDVTESALRKAFGADIDGDIIIRRFVTGAGRNMLAVYVSGMADDAKVNDFILRPLMRYSGGERRLTELVKRAVETAEAREERELKSLLFPVSDGMTALFVEGETCCLLLETRGWEKRPVGTAENENVVLGPKEGFTECAKTNVSLIRRLVHTGDLIAEQIRVSGADPVSVRIVYRRGVTNPELVAEVKRRLDGISAGTLIASGVIEQLIEERSILPIPRVLSTERPDRAASHILQGRVCLITEGSPFALIMPVTLFSLMNSPEDVYLRPPLGTVLRLTRYIGAFASVMLPGYFIALALYHQGMLTTEVLSTVIASRRMVFEPIALEMILLLLIFQLIREAGLRVPGTIGQAIGIIGGLIMGQAAVTAHLASSVVLIIVAASGLGNFCIPDYSTQIAASYIRMAMVVAAWLGGLLGLSSAVLLGVSMLAGMKSFGMPFLAPFAPKTRTKRGLILRGRIGRSVGPEDDSNTMTEAEQC